MARSTPSPATTRPPGRINQAAFFLFWVICGLFLRLWFRLRCENRPRLDGPYALVPNHASFLDPIVVGAVSTRRVFFMMTAVHYRSPLLGWFYRFNHTISVEQRRGNRHALRAARDVLRRGAVLGIFPEGGISRDGDLLLGNPGAVSLVLSEKVPIVPVGVIGADRALGFGAWFPRPKRITVRFGDPIHFEELEKILPGSRKERLEAATRLLMERIAELTGKTSREQVLEDLGSRAS